MWPTTRRLSKFVAGGGSVYNPNDNSMVIDDNESAVDAALTFVHEMNHARYAHEGLAADPKIGLVREDEAALQEHVGEVTQAEFVAQAPQHDLQDDVTRKGEVVEGRAAALVEAPPAGQTVKGSIPELSAPCPFTGRG